MARPKYKQMYLNENGLRRNLEEELRKYKRAYNRQAEALSAFFDESVQQKLTDGQRALKFHEMCAFDAYMFARCRFTEKPSLGGFLCRKYLGDPLIIEE